MLNFIDIGIDNAVAFHLSGKITEGDMEQVLSAATEKIKDHGQIVVYEELDDFTGIELKAIYKELKYLIHQGLSNISKVAVVTDKQWVQKIAGIEDRLFTGINIQCFSPEEKDRALNFLHYM